MASNLIVARCGVEYVPPISLAFLRWAAVVLLLLPFTYSLLIKNSKIIKKEFKKLFFLVAMPRSGNTLFTSIMNQNPDIACTPNSITLEIMKDLFLLKETDVRNWNK